MYGRPIGPTARGAIDHAFAAMNAPAPSPFGLAGPARAIRYGFSASRGLLNAPTDRPLGIRKVVPPRLHGRLETPYAPAIPAPPRAAGAFKQGGARLDFGAFFAVARANHLLTDHNAYEPAAPAPAGRRALELAGSALA